MVALWAACDAGTSGHEDLLPRSRCAVAVVASDYRSSSVSLLAADGSPCATDVVHSGSRPPGLLTALSGDLTLPLSPPPAGVDAEVVLIDRYPNGIISRLDAADDEVIAQVAVAPGFAGNPQDVLRLDAATALVSRLQRDPADASAGSDLLVVDWQTGAPHDRIVLDAAADPGFDPMPTRLARTGADVWVGLAHLGPRFDAAGAGRVARVDAERRALDGVVAIEGAHNCGHVAADPAGRGVWVACSGSFAQRGAPQLARSALAWIDARSRAVAWHVSAEDLAGAPLGFSLAALDDQRALVVAVGDLEAAAPDRLLLVTRATGVATPLLEAGPFELGAILVSPEAGLVLVAVADVERPRIETLGLVDLVRGRGITGYSRTGLPPRQLAFFR